MNKCILVTGGAGYVGSTLVGALLSAGYQVTVVDNLTFGGESLLGVWNNPNFKFVKADLVDFEAIKSLFRESQFDGLIHLAAIVGDPACSKQSDLALKINWDASVHLLETAVASKVKRFIFASTCSNYGKMADPHGMVDETSELTPVSLYAKLKVKFEKMLLEDFKNIGGFSPTALRFSTVYGVSPRMRFDLTVNEFARDMALKGEIEVFGEQFWRPYIHVQDVARACLLVLESREEKVRANVFNVGDTKENYQKKMIVEVIKKFLPQARVKYVPKTEDPRDYRVNFTKIQKELGFQVSRRLEDSIEDIIDICRNGIIPDPYAVQYKNVV